MRRERLGEGYQQRKASKTVSFDWMGPERFKLNFRFTRDSVRRLAEYLRQDLLPKHGNRGNPLSPFNQVNLKEKKNHFIV